MPCVCIQVWCILTDTEEADVMDRANTASHPLTVCTSPEVRTAAVQMCRLNLSLSHSSSASLTSSSLPVPPQVFVLSGVIAMVTCAVFLRLNSLLKLAALLLAMVVYSYLIHLAFLTLTRQDMLHRSVQNTHRTAQTVVTHYFFFIFSTFSLSLH